MVDDDGFVDACPFPPELGPSLISVGATRVERGVEKRLLNSTEYLSIFVILAFVMVAVLGFYENMRPMVVIDTTQNAKLPQPFKYGDLEFQLESPLDYQIIKCTKFSDPEIQYYLQLTEPLNVAFSIINHGSVAFSPVGGQTKSEFNVPQRYDGRAKTLWSCEDLRLGAGETVHMTLTIASYHKPYWQMYGRGGEWLEMHNYLGNSLAFDVESYIPEHEITLDKASAKVARLKVYAEDYRDPINYSIMLFALAHFVAMSSVYLLSKQSWMRVKLMDQHPEFGSRGE